MEQASKTAHRFIVQNEAVREFISQCVTRVKAEDVTFEGHQLLPFVPLDESDNPITNFLTFDGGYQEVVTESKYPATALAFFQFGALHFQRQDLENLEQQPFIDPDDMARLKQMQRFQFVLPLRNYVLKSSDSITNSVRRSLQDFMRQQPADDKHRLLDTLRWFLFREYLPPDERKKVFDDINCPHCRRPNIPLERQKLQGPEYVATCPHEDCKGEILLIDVLRLHEAIDDELGAGGIMGYVTTAVEQLLLIHFLHLFLLVKTDTLDSTILIKDGPLAFFGTTARLHVAMLDLVSFLQRKHKLYMVGLEKSGAFVEHAADISSLLEPSQLLLLDNDYIYKYITPGRASDTDRPYASTSYYGQKLIFKAPDESVYVATVPVPALVAFPKVENLPGLGVILTNIAKLQCNLFENALVPIALANKLVSLSNRPSVRILAEFAKGASNG